MVDAQSKGYACPRCTVGRCLPRKTTFAEIHQGSLLAIPNIQAYICDVCKLAEFEQEALEYLWQELYGEQVVDDIQTSLPQKRTSSYGE